ncbi:MAG: Ig-like domain-containing protein [Bacteroidales bacterium]|nr:Ig-like domain-containing protein [Bacteroidales bacterium]
MLLSLCLFCAVSFSCSGHDVVEEQEAPVLEDIFVNTTSVQLSVGGTASISAAPLPSKVGEVDFTWHSTDEKVATVSDGVVKAVGEGVTDVIVSALDISRSVRVEVSAPLRIEEKDNVLYDFVCSAKEKDPSILLGDAGSYSSDGISLCPGGGMARLDRFYAIARRSVKYEITPSADAVMVFQSSSGDFTVTLDVPEKKIVIATAPVETKVVDFLKGKRDFQVEIFHDYLISGVRITDMKSGKSEELSVSNDGQGGVGKGALQEGFAVGMQWDHYCFGLSSGTSALVRRIKVTTPVRKVKLMIYGDSITQPENYFPAAMFKDSWTQRIIAGMGGDAISCGRSGGVIDWVADYIRNELPYIKADYVMVTIGTNGGNTEQNLSALVEYIRSQDAIPILNNIPSNESGTQVEVNKVIARVREKYGIKGALFDLATSLNGDGLEVDKSMMFWEDYSPESVFHGWQVYHHPNDKGGEAMFKRACQDVPELFK